MNFDYYAGKAPEGVSNSHVDHPLNRIDFNRLNNDSRRMPDIRSHHQHDYFYNTALLAPVNFTQLADCTSVVSGGLVRYDVDLQSRNIDLKSEIEQLRALVSELQIENRDFRSTNRAIASKISEDWSESATLHNFNTYSESISKIADYWSKLKLDLGR